MGAGAGEASKELRKLHLRPPQYLSARVRLRLLDSPLQTSVSQRDAIEALFPEEDLAEFDIKTLASRVQGNWKGAYGKLSDAIYYISQQTGKIATFPLIAKELSLIEELSQTTDIF